MNTLKTSIISIFCLFLPLSSLLAVTNEKGSDTLTGLQIKGRIVKTEGPSGDLCKVELFLKGKVVDSVFTSDNRAFSFTLARNNMYTLRITKKNHVSKLVVVNTEFPGEISDVLHFSFKTDLLSIEAAKELNQDALDFPAAIVHFENRHEIFVINETYTAGIKREIYSNPGQNEGLLAKDSK